MIILLLFLILLSSFILADSDYAEKSNNGMSNRMVDDGFTVTTDELYSENCNNQYCTVKVSITNDNQNTQHIYTSGIFPTILDISKIYVWENISHPYIEYSVESEEYVADNESLTVRYNSIETLNDNYYYDWVESAITKTNNPSKTEKKSKQVQVKSGETILFKFLIDYVLSMDLQKFDIKLDHSLNDLETILDPYLNTTRYFHDFDNLDDINITETTLFIDTVESYVRLNTSYETWETYSENLIYHFTLEGDYNDSSGNDYDLSCTTCPDWIDDSEGNPTSALNFTKADSEDLHFSNVSQIDDTDASTTCVKGRIFSTAISDTIFSATGSGNWDRITIQYDNTQNYEYLYMADEESRVGYVPFTNIGTDDFRWMCYVLNNSNDAYAYFLNSTSTSFVLGGSDTTSMTYNEIASISNARIGSYEGYVNLYSDSLVDEFVMWNVSLDSDELTEIFYNKGNNYYTNYNLTANYLQSTNITNSSNGNFKRVLLTSGDSNATNVTYGFSCNDGLNWTNISDGELTNCSVSGYDFIYNVSMFGEANYTPYMYNVTFDFTYNIIPQVTTPTINQTLIFVNTTDLEVNTTYSDNDTDTGSVYFEWFVNGVSNYTQTNTSVPDGTLVNSILNVTGFTLGEIINVTVYSNDDVDNSSLLASNQIEVIADYPIITYDVADTTSLTGIPLDYSVNWGNGVENNCFYSINLSDGVPTGSQDVDLINCSNTTISVSTIGDYIIELNANNTNSSLTTTQDTFSITAESGRVGGGGGGGNVINIGINDTVIIDYGITVLNINVIAPPVSTIKDILVKNTGYLDLENGGLEVSGNARDYLNVTFCDLNLENCQDNVDLNSGESGFLMVEATIPGDYEGHTDGIISISTEFDDFELVVRIDDLPGSFLINPMVYFFQDNGINRTMSIFLTFTILLVCLGGFVYVISKEGIL